MDHILSLSGGKDSTAMLLHILELLDSGDDSYPLDEVVFADTGLEFPEMYEHLKKLRKVVVEHGIKWTMLKPEYPFEYYLYEHEYVGKDGTVHHGYGWAGARTRWCTKNLKVAMTDRMMREKKKHMVYGYCFRRVTQALKGNQPSARSSACRLGMD